MTDIAESIRKTTAAIQRAIDSGQRSRRIDADDLIEVLLTIADEIDPLLGELVDPSCACPGCGERRPDQLVWHEDQTVRCSRCNKRYTPPRPPR